MRQEGGRKGGRDEARGPHFVPTLTFICGSDGGGVGICWLRPSTFAAGIALTYMPFCGFIKQQSGEFDTRGEIVFSSEVRADFFFELLLQASG